MTWSETGCWVEGGQWLKGENEKHPGRNFRIDWVVTCERGLGSILNLKNFQAAKEKLSAIEDVNNLAPFMNEF